MSADLIEKIQESPDNENHWAAWYQRVYPKIYYLAFRFSRGNSEAAKDLTQEAFTRFLTYGAIDRVTNEEHAQAFLMKTCRNLAVDRDQHAREIPLEDIEEGELDANVKRQAEPSVDLDKVVRNLNADERQFIDWIRAGFSLSEIAKKLGITYTAAGVRLHRIRGRLRKSFGLV